MIGLLLSPGTFTSRPSPPGKVAVTTIYPLSRKARHKGLGGRSERTPGPSMEYRPIGAENPVTVDPNGLTTSANVFEGILFRGAVEPVAMAMCAAAVSEGAIVTFCSAQTPLRFNRPMPE